MRAIHTVCAVNSPYDKGLDRESERVTQLAIDVDSGSTADNRLSSMADDGEGLDCGGVMQGKCPEDD